MEVVHETEANLESASGKTRVCLRNKGIVAWVRIWNLLPWCSITSDVICTIEHFNSVNEYETIWAGASNPLQKSFSIRLFLWILVDSHAKGLSDNSEYLNLWLSKLQESNITNACDCTENFITFSTDSEGTYVDEKLSFDEEEIKQVSRLPSCVGRVKDTEELQPKSSESGEKTDKLCSVF